MFVPAPPHTSMAKTENFTKGELNELHRFAQVPVMTIMQSRAWGKKISKH